jgi:hypothetical protein
MQITVDWSSSFKPDKLDADMLARGQTAMVKVVTKIRNRAKARLIVRKAKGAGLGGRATGTLARSIVPSVRVSHTEIEGTVKVGVPYGKYVEGWNSANEHKAAEKHYVYGNEGSGIYNWFLRHGKIKRGSKQRLFWVGGPDSITPFLEPAFLEVLPSAREILAGSITSG